MKVENIKITVNSDNKIEMSTNTVGASIYYTLDGSKPSSSSTLYSETINYPNKKLIKAIGILEGNDNSDITEYQCYKLLTQDKINESNKIYKITDDYDLGSKTINIPEGCTLQFDGGSFNNGILNGNDTNINVITNYSCIFVECIGTWNIKKSRPEWFGAKGDGINDDRIAIQTAINISDEVIFSNKKYIIGYIEYQPGQFGNLFINKNIKLYGDSTILHLLGHGKIFTPLGASNTSPIYEQYRLKGVQLLTENVEYMSTTLTVSDASGFNVGDIIILRGEDARLGTDYEEASNWMHNVIKSIDGNNIQLELPIPFSIDLSKCNQVGISSPTINGSICPIVVTNIEIDNFVFNNDTITSIFAFYACKNIKLTNITVNNAIIASFKFCTSIFIDNIYQYYNNDINGSNYGGINLWGVNGCHIGKIYRYDKGITTNLNTCRIISTEGTNYETIIDYVYYVTDYTGVSGIYWVIGENVHIKRVIIYSKYDAAIVARGYNIYIDNLELHVIEQLRKNRLELECATQVFLDSNVKYNNISIEYYNKNIGKIYKYEFNVNNIICSKSYIVTSDRKIADDVFSGGSLCLVGASINHPEGITSANLVVVGKFSTEGLISKTNQYSKVTAFIRYEDIINTQYNTWYITFNDSSLVTDENPCVIELFFTPITVSIVTLDDSRIFYVSNKILSKTPICNNENLGIKSIAIYDNSIIKSYNNMKINKQIGTTDERPTLTSTDEGFEYYDSTLKKKILWNGTEWTNLDGSALA